MAQESAAADKAVAMQDQLKALVRTSHANLLNQIDRLGGMLAAIGGQGADCAAAIRDAEGLAHQIKGASGSIGFPDVSQSATVLDNHLKSLVALGAAVSADQVKPSLELFADLRRTAESTTPESSTLYGADLSRR
ncbi:MAG: Hpt domain-containing protein [Hyphomicrobiales bacterium]